MKNLKSYKFFESIDFSEPIDVESDLMDFKDKLIDSPKAKDWWYRRVSGIKNDLKEHAYNEIMDTLIGKINTIISENPTMTDKYQIYRVFGWDEEVFVKAVSYAHAFIKASVILDNPAIVYHRVVKGKTDEWKSVIVSKEGIESEIKKCEEKLRKLNNIR